MLLSYIPTKGLNEKVNEAIGGWKSSDADWQRKISEKDSR